MIKNGQMKYVDLFEIDTKIISQGAMLQFLRPAFRSNSKKFIEYKLW